MSILDSLIGQLTGSTSNTSGGQSSLVQVVMNMIQQHPDGLSGLIAKFEQGGLGQEAASWVGTGANLPISAQQLQGVLGSDQVRAIASKLGMSSEEASGHLAQVFPQVVDKLTPEGRVPESGALGGLLAMLQRGTTTSA
jgi:uncharacterized protein YidB (DUF937 family)